ncbi:SDR family oxidoreductase, partial [Paenibacillus sepulcri]|nr:SDR family oxidoreductase [Paenibacillus sepulcri]
DEQVRARIAGVASRIPLGRFATTDEVGEAAVYLASDKAGYMTGTTVYMDGGALLPVWADKGYAEAKASGNAAYVIGKRMTAGDAGRIQVKRRRRRIVMKITDMKLYHVKPRWLFLKIETDEGISGWGEPIVEGRALTVATAVEELKRYLIGQDPLRIEHHWQIMYRGTFYRGGPVLVSAISGIEQALWDIKGKFYNMP